MNKMYSKGGYGYDKYESNCCGFGYDSYKTGGLVVQSEPSNWFEYPDMFPRDMQEALEYMNKNNKGNNDAGSGEGGGSNANKGNNKRT
ncbi:MAG: hypothetical protein P9M13_10800 [Candidatus Ancaeobacter aquaticus]|nr:hypothetical protein [Candidatus Ancaeobacter aquaticus]